MINPNFGASDFSYLNSHFRMIQIIAVIFPVGSTDSPHVEQDLLLRKLTKIGGFTKCARRNRVIFLVLETNVMECNCNQNPLLHSLVVLIGSQGILLVAYYNPY